jgi:hypothetical protein
VGGFCVEENKSEGGIQVEKVATEDSFWSIDARRLIIHPKEALGCWSFFLVEYSSDVGWLWARLFGNNVNPLLLIFKKVGIDTSDLVVYWLWISGQPLCEDEMDCGDWREMKKILRQHKVRRLFREISMPHCKIPTSWLKMNAPIRPLLIISCKFFSFRHKIEALEIECQLLHACVFPQ